MVDVLFLCLFITNSLTPTSQISSLKTSHFLGKKLPNAVVFSELFCSMLSNYGIRQITDTVYKLWRCGFLQKSQFNLHKQDLNYVWECFCADKSRFVSIENSRRTRPKNSQISVENTVKIDSK